MAEIAYDMDRIGIPDVAEEWRYYSDTPYEVSSFGKVRRGTRVLRPRYNKQGYIRVLLSVSGNRRDEFVHRMVCSAFHGPAPTSESHADHINGTRCDNRSDNLRWLTPLENIGRRKTAIGIRHGSAKLDDKAVIEIRASPLSSRSIAPIYGVSDRTVRDIRAGKYWGHVK